VTPPFGDSPSGSILYQPDGRMSAHVSVANPPRFTAEDPPQASMEEVAQAWRSYFGYWGSFQVDPEKRLVLHRVEGCSFSNWIGTEQVRHFRFDAANRLILETSSSSGHSKLIWQRVPR
jgi:Lipocalin-like domain